MNVNMSDFSKNKNGEKIVWFSQQHKYEMVDTEIVGYKESDIIADIQIGPTDQGMVRIFVSSNKIEIPMDFSPDEAINIADELKASAETAKNI